MERYPAGIAKKGFIQKDVSKGFPEWLVSSPSRPGRNARQGRMENVDTGAYAGLPGTPVE
jgi:DNA primase